jgi:hypothetical protein
MRFYRNTTALLLTTMVIIVLSIIVMFNDYSDNKITGYDIVNTKVELFPTQSKNCSFELYPGWNMVSFYCFGMYVDRNIALQSLNDTYVSIFEYQTNDINDPWKSYTFSLPNWTLQQLNYMDRVSGYWIYMLDNATFSYSGIYSDSNIYLYNGWNFVGYPLINSTNINDSQNDLSFNMVKYYNTSAELWLVYINNSANNTLNKFETYKGYWLNVSGDHQWKIVRG